MIILDNKNGNLTKEHLLKRCTSSSLPDGDVHIYNDNFLTDIIIIKTWEYLLSNMPNSPSNLFKNIIDKISKKDNEVKIHLIILGNKHIFLNKNKAKFPNEIRSLDIFIDDCNKYGIVLNEKKSYPSIADYVLLIDRNSKVVKKGKKEIAVRKLPKVGARTITNVPESVPEPVHIMKEVSITTIVNSNHTANEYNISIEKEDNIVDEPETLDMNLLKLMWTSIPGITDKIVDSIMSITSIISLYNGDVSAIAAAKYNTGTRFGIGRARNLIDQSKNQDTFNLILTNIPTLSNEDRQDIINNYNLGNILNDMDEIKRKYPDSVKSLLLLDYKINQ